MGEGVHEAAGGSTGQSGAGVISGHLQVGQGAGASVGSDVGIKVGIGAGVEVG